MIRMIQRPIVVVSCGCPGVSTNRGGGDEIVPADAHYAAEGCCVEGIEAFLLSFGKFT